MENKMIAEIKKCIDNNLSLGDMFEHIISIFDLNNIEINNTFNKVFFANFSLSSFYGK